jgi:flagellar motor protein MotB
MSSAQVNGQIIQQSSSYRQGLVLGFTMAEIILLLLFCLLIAMAAFLRSEQAKLDTAHEQLRKERGESKQAREFIGAIANQPGLSEYLKSQVGSSNPAVVSEFWRDLVDSHTVVSEAKRSGLSLQEIRERLSSKPLEEKGNSEQAKRDAEIIASIAKVMPNVRSTSVEKIVDIVQKGLQSQGSGGHQWPPIINLSEAGGNRFRIGSAELSPEFRDKLRGPIPELIVSRIKEYDVDVIEVVGHTDEQPIAIRTSNLDKGLLPILNGTSEIGTVVPADNAGLGLARAVSVVSLLLQNPALARYKILPLSGAQLINNDETLAISGISVDIPQRRRIEIRLRKSTPHDLSMSTPSAGLVPEVRARPRVVVPPAGKSVGVLPAGKSISAPPAVKKGAPPR